MEDKESGRLDGRSANALREPDAERADALQELDGRRAVYTFLSAAFAREMTAGFLAALRDEPPALDGELDRFARSLTDADLEQVRIDLAAEYARLFLGMSRSPVAPYESVYTSEVHLLMQEARDEVRAAFRGEGFALAKDVRLPEDHVAFEFEFMARLCEKELAAREAGDGVEADRCRGVQARFVEGHLANWVGQLCDDVLARARTPFYRGVAELASSFVDAECQLLVGGAA